MLIRGIADYKVKYKLFFLSESNKYTLLLVNFFYFFFCHNYIFNYKDGTRRKEWQQYAALMAAAVLKSIIVKMEQM